MKIYLIIISLILFSLPAHAYIDPGTGSFVAQIVVAVVVGALVSIKSFWVNIKTFFTGLFSGAQDNQDEEIE